jgi:hypothetical protein
MGNVTMICPAPAQRRRRLLAQQNLKMARSAHAYVRGNTLHFYKWLNSRTHCTSRTVRRSGSAVTAMSAIWVRLPALTLTWMFRYVISTKR